MSDLPTPEQIATAEVREEWGVRITWRDGATDDDWRDTRAAAEKVIEAQREIGWMSSTLVRRLHLTLPAEEVDR